MNILIAANIFESLGMSWQKMLLYLANFVVLDVALTFLVFKPVKKFMNNRQKQIEDEVNSANKIKEEAEAIKAESEEKVKTAEDEVKKGYAELEEEKASVSDGKERILKEAREEAEKIIESAKNEAKAEKEKIIAEAKTEITGIAVALAKNILEREITEADNEKLIDECIKDIKKQ